MNKVVYNDFAAAAERYATVPAEGSTAYQSAGDLINEDARELINYASFTGNGINLLDFSLEFAETDDNIGYVSSAASNSQRVFSPSVDIVIDLAEGFYSAPGITIHFWQNYCSEFSVTWYRDSDEIEKATFYPFFNEAERNQNLLTFYGAQAVENFNRIVVSFMKSELPNQFVKIAGIDLGKQNIITNFHSNINLFFEINTDAADVPGSTCEFVAEIDTFEPEESQILYVYGKDKLFGKFTVKEVTQNGKNKYLIKCVDDSLRMDGTIFPKLEQGEHSSNDVIEELINSSGVSIASQMQNKTLQGFVLPDKTSRYALAMLCFGLGAFVTGYGSKKLTIKEPRNRKTKMITSDQILGKATYKKTTPYTSITLKSFRYDFNTVNETRTLIVENKKASISANEKQFVQYSLIGDIDERINELAKTAFFHNEIIAYVELTDEEIGDILGIETPYNGIKTGIIKSMEISIGHKIMATLTLVERDFVENGGDS